jgi:sulfur carrier protein
VILEGMERMTIALTVNGSEENVAAGTVAELLAARGLEGGPRGVAVALNGAVVPRARWAETPLAAGDAVEIVHALQGG